MTIQPGAEGRLGVVDMEGEDALQADAGRTLFEGPRIADGGPDVVAGGKQVTGVDADADALGTLDARQQGAQLDEGAADHRPRARGVLEGDLDACPGRAAGDEVERGHDARE